MTGFLLLLFILGALVLLVRLFAWGLTERTMPWSCPRCYFGGDTDLADQPRGWYVRLSNERVKCRSCRREFKEHPNGSLVEDRDS